MTDQYCLSEKSYHLLYLLHLNGIEAMHIKGETHNTSYFDAKRAEVEKRAIELYQDKVPKLVLHFMKNHYADEVKHGHKLHAEREPFADELMGFLEKKLVERGLVSYFAVALLMEERIAFAQACLGKHEDDPHSDESGFTDEYYHGTTPLVIIPMLSPTEKELETALKDQEELFALLKSPVPKSPWAGYFLESLTR